MCAGIGGFIDPQPQKALIYPEQKHCTAERACSFSTWMESESTEVSQETWVSQGFKPNFADSGVKSTELDKIVCFFFPPHLYKQTIWAIISNTGREPCLFSSTYPWSLVSNNRKQNQLNAFCWGWEMTTPSFPIHSDLSLDLLEADFSLIGILLLAIPIDCITQTWSLSGCCLRKRCHVLVDIGPVIRHLVGSEAYSVAAGRYFREQQA